MARTKGTVLQPIRVTSAKTNRPRRQQRRGKRQTNKAQIKREFEHVANLISIYIIQLYTSFIRTEGKELKTHNRSRQTQKTLLFYLSTYFIKKAF